MARLFLSPCLTGRVVDPDGVSGTGPAKEGLKSRMLDRRSAFT